MPIADRIPDSFRDFFDRPVLAHLATVMPDGSPQVTPVWIGEADGLLLVNTIIGRQKDRNLGEQVRVALTMVDPDDPYRYMQVRGVVIAATTDGAEKNIDQLSLRYTGVPYPRHDPTRPRKLFKIKPTRVIYQERVGEIK